MVNRCTANQYQKEKEQQTSTYENHLSNVLAEEYEIPNLGDGSMNEQEGKKAMTSRTKQGESESPYDYRERKNDELTPASMDQEQKEVNDKIQSARLMTAVTNHLLQQV